MKYLIKPKCKAEDFFDCMSSPFVKQYLVATGKEITFDEISEGFTYKARASNSRIKNAFATITLIKYDRPNCYRFRYVSETCVKESGFKILGTDGDKLIVEIEEYYCNLAEGEKPEETYHDFDKDEYKVVKFKNRGFTKAVEKFVKQRDKQ